MNDLKVLMTIHKKEVKTATRMKKGGAGKLSGFNKPEHIPESLRQLLDIDEVELPRSKVTKILYKYIEDNNMYNTNTKKQIMPNKKMKKIFGIETGDNMTFYNFQTWLKKVYNEDNGTNETNINCPDNVLVVDD